MQIQLPYAGIVLLIGPSNSGKSTLLKNMIDKEVILSSEVISSDDYRVLVSNYDFIDWSNRPRDEAASLMDEYSSISAEAFMMMDSVIEARCRLNKLTFVDATHLYSEDRKRYIGLARKHNVPVVAVVLDLPENELLLRDEQRDKPRGKKRIKQQYQTFKREKSFIKKEGYLSVYTIKETDNLEFIRRNNLLEKDIQHGIDIIGDIHGCFDEMTTLLEKLGYQKDTNGLYLHPEGRKFVSIGDVMSRGPESLKTLLFFHDHIQQDLAYMIDSNHGWKIARWLDGRDVTMNHGDEKVVDEFVAFEAESGNEKAQQTKYEIKEFLLQVPSHYVFTKNGVPTLICAHAGIRDDMIGKESETVSDFCRFGDTDGHNDKGKPVRKDWTIHHKKSSLIVWGHDPKPRPLVINNTINIDQGVVFGGALTAFRYPEEEFVSVQAKQDYSGAKDNPLKEWEKNRLNPPNLGKFITGYSVTTEELGEIKIHQDIVKPAIDTVSHFTIPIEQLIYIPPTMSPTPSPSSLDDYLEHPKEAIAYYRSQGIQTMVAEKKHMGSRGILLLFKDTESAIKHTSFDSLGVIYSRTGKRFFDSETEQRIVSKINQELHEKEYFAKYNTDYLLLDAEIMPWNLKAKELISSQYAHVAENAIFDRTKLKGKIEEVIGQNEALNMWLEEYNEKLNNAHIFSDVFQKYCWDIEDIHSIQVAPFHVLAHSDKTFFDQPHTWHMEKNREFAKQSELFVETEFKVITDEASEEEVINWWKDITSEGHEGIVIKPEYYIARNKGKLVQPAIKVRGRKYLNIIYGMDYLLPQNLKRLKDRNTGKKQKLALKEFALGIEGVERYIQRESIERVHECVLGTLALESDPVDPRL